MRDSGRARVLVAVKCHAGVHAARQVGWAVGEMAGQRDVPSPVRRTDLMFWREPVHAAHPRRDRQVHTVRLRHPVPTILSAFSGPQGSSVTRVIHSPDSIWARVRWVSASRARHDGVQMHLVHTCHHPRWLMALHWLPASQPPCWQSHPRRATVLPRDLCGGSTRPNYTILSRLLTRVTFWVASSTPTAPQMTLTPKLQPPLVWSVKHFLHRVQRKRCEA
jgi:hypothetical protein